MYVHLDDIFFVLGGKHQLTLSFVTFYIFLECVSSIGIYFISFMFAMHVDEIVYFSFVVSLVPSSSDTGFDHNKQKTLRPENKQYNVDFFFQMTSCISGRHSFQQKQR